MTHYIKGTPFMKENAKEEIKASPELSKFFERLLDLKDVVRRRAEKTKNSDLDFVYTSLEALIKEGK